MGKNLNTFSSMALLCTQGPGNFIANQGFSSDWNWLPKMKFFFLPLSPCTKKTNLFLCTLWRRMG